MRGGKPGVYQFKTLAVSTGSDGDQYPEVALATLVSDGRPVAPIALPAARQFPPVEDLRGRRIDRERTFRFTDSPSVATR